jgi:sortase (surface protein transpeptidase)
MPGPGVTSELARRAQRDRVNLQAPPPAATDMRVVITSIGVDAPVVRLWLNSDGTLQVPTNFADAGWWSGGPLPGAAGAAVIVGHVSSVSGPGVFFRLHELAPGDMVTVERAGTADVSFRVIRLIEVAKTAFPSVAVYGPASGDQLRLITCGGQFDYATGHFLDNLIVFATRE